MDEEPETKRSNQIDKVIREEKLTGRIAIVFVILGVTVVPYLAARQGAAAGIRSIVNG